MKRITASLAVAVLCAAATVSAEYSVWDKGTWPASWPKELEPLRKQARTFEGPIDQLRYLIPFTKREDFEAVWPHLLTVKTKGAPIILVRGPKLDFFEIKPAGVLIQSPPARIDKEDNPEIPLSGVADVRMKWRNATFFELVVDGKIVDLNRLPLPADTPIVDERFKELPSDRPAAPAPSK
jgi:hypothetical protein